MNKAYTYLFIMSGIMLVFYFAGLSTEAGTLLSYLLEPENLNSTSMWITIVSAIGAASVAGLIVGISTRNVELAAAAPIALFLLTLGFDFIKIFIYMASLNSVLAILFFSPLMLLYPLTILEFWRGRDT